MPTRSSARVRHPAESGPAAVSRGAGNEDSAFEFESLDFPATERKLFNSYFAEFCALAPEKVRLHQHQGVDFIYMLKGRLALKEGTDTEFLEAGDSLYFDSQLPRGYSGEGTKLLSTLVVTVE